MGAERLYASGDAELARIDYFPGADRISADDFCFRRYGECGDGGWGESDSCECYGPDHLWPRHAQCDDMVSSECVCGSARLHIWRCWAELSLRSRHADDGRCCGAHVQPDRGAEVRDARRVFQCVESHEPGYAKPLCKYGRFRLDHRGDDAWTRNSDQ